VVLSLALAFGVAATSLFILGMESLLGMAGLGVGAVLMMFVATPLSGLAAGRHWLPQPWGFIGQRLPIGAAFIAISARRRRAAGERAEVAVSA